MKSQYTDWIKQQIDDIGLEENKDFKFGGLNPKTSSPQGGRPTKDYFLKVSTAKEVAMVARVKKGGCLKFDEGGI